MDSMSGSHASVIESQPISSRNAVSGFNFTNIYHTSYIYYVDDLY